MSLSKRILPGAANHELDDAGKALRDRLIRLGAKKSSAYTALSLLKGYSSFKIGACLDLNDGVYKSYAIVGLGITRLSLSLAGLLHEDQAFLKIPDSELTDLKFAGAGMNVWIFALDDSDPCKCLLLAAEEDGSAFNPETIALILAETNEVFFPSAAAIETAPESFDLELPGEAAAETETEVREAPDPEVLEPELAAELPEETAASPEETRSKIAEYQRSNTVVQGILLDIPGRERKAGLSFARQVALAVGALGLSFVIPSGRILVLLPPRFDRELFAHRLSTSFATEVLACFEADDPDKALELIQLYL
jgi:hypothetical protein